MDQLEEIRASRTAILDMVTFSEGHRYDDYKKGDKVADYGLAALITGGVGLAVAKKTGLLAIILIAFKKFFVFILAGIAVAFGYVRRLLTGGDKG